MTAKKYSINTTLLNQKHATGVVSELKATQFLIKNGFLVFTNTSPNGLIDIIAVNDKGKVFLIDVKTIKISGSGAKRTKLQKELGVILVSFDRQTRKLAWVNHQN